MRYGELMENVSPSLKGTHEKNFPFFVSGCNFLELHQFSGQ